MTLYVVVIIDMLNTIISSITLYKTLMRDFHMFDDFDYFEEVEEELQENNFDPNIIFWVLIQR